MESIISPQARIHESAKIGAFCRVHDNVVIAAGVEIGDHCILGHPSERSDGSPLVIGEGALIRSHSVFYEGSSFGPELTTGHRVIAMEGTRCGKGVQLGTQAEIQGDCAIGDYVRTQSGVFIPKFTTIEDFVWLFPHVILTNDPHPPSEAPIVGPILKRFAAIGAGACIHPGRTVGEGSLVAAGAQVTKDVAPGMAVAGVPARVLCEAGEIGLRDGTGRPAYPWNRHFQRGYPPEIVASWLSGS